MTKTRTQHRGRKDAGRSACRRASVFACETLEQRQMMSVVALPNSQVTNDPGVQQQPSLVVDPSDAQHVVIAYMDRSLVNSGYAGIGISISHDGGTTWTQSSIPLPDGFDQGAANPMAKFDAKGHLFISFSAVTFLGAKPPLSDPNGSNPDTGDLYRTYGLTSTNGIFIARSDDGGASFSAPVAIASHVYGKKTKIKVPFDIKPDIAIDTFRKLPNGKKNPNYGDIYAIWSRYYPAGEFPGEPTSDGGSTLQVAVSTDGGNSFSVRLPPPTKDHPVPISVIQDSYFSGIGPGEGLAPPTGVTWRSARRETFTRLTMTLARSKSFTPPTRPTPSTSPIGIMMCVDGFRPHQRHRRHRRRA